MTTTITPRIVIAFLSSPGDMASAKDALHDTIDQIGARFAPYGLVLRDWRNETQTHPAYGKDPMEVVRRQMPAEFDIYVGLLGGRLGTPTPRAPSGTIEEFQVALDLVRRTGRPHILFYFGPAGDGKAADAASVREFRSQYPGLYFDFSDLVDLRTKFTNHLVDLLLQELYPPSPVTPLRERPWALGLAALLDAADSAAGARVFRNGSAVVADCLSRTENLFALATVLSREESQLLLGSAYVHRLLLLGAPAETLDRAGAALGDQFPVPAAVVMTTAYAACDGYDLQNADLQFDGVRGDLVACLIRLSYSLGLHRASLAVDACPQPGLPEDLEADALAAYLTDDVKTTRGGVVGLRLRLPAGQLALARNFAGAVSVRFDLRWQTIRRTMARYRLAVVREQTTWFAAPAMPALPEEILGFAADLRRKAAELTLELAHLGGPESASPAAGTGGAHDFRSLLPLPQSRIDRPYTITSGLAVRHFLRLAEVLGDGQASSRNLVIEARDGTLTLDPATLKDDSWYRWELYRDDGDFETAVRSGLVGTLGPRDRLRLSLWPGGGGRHDLLAKAARFGLWSDAFQDLYPAVLAGSSTPEEDSFVHQLLADACDWSVQNAGQTTQAELYRNATNAVSAAIQQRGTRL